MVKIYIFVVFMFFLFWEIRDNYENSEGRYYLYSIFFFITIKSKYFVVFFVWYSIFMIDYYIKG